MSSSLANLVFRSARPGELAEFWSALLGWTEPVQDGQGVAVRPSDVDGCAFGLEFGASTAGKVGQNRLHLDLASRSPADQQATVERALRLGARRADIGQSAELPWQVLADPDGNELCVLEPRPEYAATGALPAVVLAADDPPGLARFWADAIGWEYVHDSADLAGLRPPNRRGPWLEFIRAGDTGWDRHRLRLRLSAGSARDAEAERMAGLGAGRNSAADPEGNEFDLT